LCGYTTQEINRFQEGVSALATSSAKVAALQPTAMEIQHEGDYRIEQGMAGANGRRKRLPRRMKKMATARKLR